MEDAAPRNSLPLWNRDVAERVLCFTGRAIHPRPLCTTVIDNQMRGASLRSTALLVGIAERDCPLVSVSRREQFVPPSAARSQHFAERVCGSGWALSVACTRREEVDVGRLVQPTATHSSTR